MAIKVNFLKEDSPFTMCQATPSKDLFDALISQTSEPGSSENTNNEKLNIRVKPGQHLKMTRAATLCCPSVICTRTIRRKMSRTTKKYRTKSSQGTLSPVTMTTTRSSTLGIYFPSPHYSQTSPSSDSEAAMFVQFFC